MQINRGNEVSQKMNVHPSFDSSLPARGRRAIGLLAFTLLLAGAGPESSASAQAPELEPSMATLHAAAAADGESDLWLAPEYRRAVRTARTGGTFLAVGLTTTLVGTVLMHRGTNMECPSEEWFCGWTQSMSGIGLVIGGVTTSLLSSLVLGIGVAKRNRLEAGAHRTYALRAGPASVAFDMTF